MAYWLCITNERNWRTIREKQVWGVGSRRTLSKVKIGDKFIFYLKREQIGKITKEPRIVGVFEVCSEIFEDSSAIFDRSYRYRVKLKPIRVLENPIEFKPLVPRLKFIRNKKNWGGELRGKSMREIPEEDFRLIMAEIERISK